jgi:formamidopyrimidine-DNA glycosylase
VPELPDVEGFRRSFLQHAAGRTVTGVEADPTILRNVMPGELAEALVGHRFEEPERLGKWLLCWTDGPALLFHFGMTGHFVWSVDEPDRHRWDRLTLAFDDGEELRYRNMRKLGGVWLGRGPDEVSAILGRVGPDALGLTERRFVRLLDNRRGGVKAALMDQSVLAGVGNLLADEILWQAGIHPRRRIDTLSPEERVRLARRMRSVVRRTAAEGDGAMARGRWLMPVRGTPDARCPRCGTPLARTVAAGRTTYFCPTCQPEP